MLEAIQKRLEHNKEVSLGRKKIEPLLGRELLEAQVKAGGSASRFLVHLSCDIAELVWTHAAKHGFEGMASLGARALESARAWANGERNLTALEEANDAIRRSLNERATLVAVMSVPVKTARYFDPEWLLTRDENERPVFLQEGVWSICELLHPNAAHALRDLRSTEWHEEQNRVFDLVRQKTAHS